MQLHSSFVEYAIRDEQEAERRAQQRVDRQGGIISAVPSPSLARRCLHASGQMLVTLGEALEQLGRAHGFRTTVGREAATQ
jgi:hypothetical protein